MIFYQVKYFLRCFFSIIVMNVMMTSMTAQSRDTTIYISAVGGLQFDLVRFQVEPGMKVKLTLANKDDMAHI